jgi:hypothetical protein
MELYLFLWACSLTLPYFHFFLPRLFRSDDWPVIHYFSGNLGFIVSAGYLKRFHDAHNAHRMVLIGVALTLVGYGWTVLGFVFITPLETTGIGNWDWIVWVNTTPNVVMMTVGLFITIRAVHWGDVSTSPLHALVADVAHKSYGMYLAHYMTRDLCFHLIDKYFDISVLFKIPLIAVCTFTFTYALIKIISSVPRSKLVIG